MVTVRLAAPGLAAERDLADLADLLRSAGAPVVRLADARMSSDVGVELDFHAACTDPTLARHRVLDAVRERTSMDARFGRWVVKIDAVRNET